MTLPTTLTAVALATSLMAFSTPASAQAATPTQLKRQVTQLKKTNRALKNQLRTSQRRVTRIQTEKSNLTAERNRIAGERNMLLAGLPAAIEAVPLDDTFLEIVLSPAYRRWTCRDQITGSGFWSISFHSRSLCA